MRLSYRLIVLMAALFFILSCPGAGSGTTLYNHAQLRIRNSPVNPRQTSMIYKGAMIDDYTEGGDAGEKVIKTILPTNTPINLGVIDTIDLNWSKFDNDVFVKVYWGGDDCYDNSTDFFEISDGEVIQVDLSTDTAPNWRIVR